MIDEEKKYVHSVVRRVLDEFREGKREKVIAECGKCFAPTIFDKDTNKLPLCPECYKADHRFPIAA